MKTQYYAAASLDGFIADQHDSLDWLLRLGMPEQATYEAFISRIGAIAMGSRTFSWLLREHVRPDGPGAQPWPYNVPTWVFTSADPHRFPSIEAADIRFVSGDVRPVHIEMCDHLRSRRSSPRSNIWLCGGGALAAQFLDAGLIDEIIVQIASLTLGGAGAPLLPRDLRDQPLRLDSVHLLDDNFAQLRYSVPR